MFDEFYELIVKQASLPMRTAQSRLMKLPKPPGPKLPRPGSFGVSTATKTSEYETMDRGKWKQTAKDLPLVALAGGAGYGIGKTLGDVAAQKLLERGYKVSPEMKAVAPLLMSALSSSGAYMFGRSREEMRKRREEAKTSGVEPAPQSRRLPKKKPSDPWKYDPRPAGWI